MLGSGKPVVISPTVSTPCGGQVEHGREDDADDQRDERAGHPRSDALEEQDADQGADAEDGGGRVDQADRFLDHADEALERRAADRREPEQGRQLADRDRDGQSDHEPGHHRDRQELGQESESRARRPRPG